MALSAKLQLRQSQALVMTPQLMQSIRLLQFTHAELERFVDEEIERNPLLERHEAAEDGGGGVDLGHALFLDQQMDESLRHSTPRVRYHRFGASKILAGRKLEVFQRGGRVTKAKPERVLAGRFGERACRSRRTTRGWSSIRGFLRGNSVHRHLIATGVVPWELCGYTDPYTFTGIVGSCTQAVDNAHV